MGRKHKGHVRKCIKNKVLSVYIYTYIIERQGLLYELVQRYRYVYTNGLPGADAG